MMRSQTDGASTAPAHTNLRSLLQEASERLDARIEAKRRETPLSKLRGSDAKVFWLISQRARHISDIARVLRISRQAAHASCVRLLAMNAIALESSAENRRIKIARIAGVGLAAQIDLQRRLNALDGEVAASLGSDQFELLVGLLEKLLKELRPAARAVPHL